MSQRGCGKTKEQEASPVVPTLAKNARMGQPLHWRCEGGPAPEITHAWLDKSGNAHAEQHPTPKTVAMQIAFVLKNFGPLPALNFQQNTRAFLDEAELSPKHILQKAYTLNPSQEVSVKSVMGEPVYSDLVKKQNKVLIYCMTFSYDGPEGHYEEQDDERYDPITNDFIPTGVCPKA